MSYFGDSSAPDVSEKAPEATEGRVARRPHITAESVWMVFARRTYEEPLRQVGTVEADDAELARVYARSIYDEFAWIEMMIVPRDAAITVIAS